VGTTRYRIDGYDDRRAARTGGEAETVIGHRSRPGCRARKTETATTEIARIPDRFREVPHSIDVRGERGQATDTLHAYTGSLTGQMGYITAQVHSQNRRLNGDLQEGDGLCDGGGFRKVDLLNLESHEYRPIHGAVQ
jgi:hypothetical protein